MPVFVLPPSQELGLLLALLFSSDPDREAIRLVLNDTVMHIPTEWRRDGGQPVRLQMSMDQSRRLHICLRHYIQGLMSCHTEWQHPELHVFLKGIAWRRDGRVILEGHNGMPGLIRELRWRPEYPEETM